jgi:hypothetical protein
MLSVSEVRRQSTAVCRLDCALTQASADSPRANLCRSELKTPRAFASCALLIFGAALYLFSRTQQMRVAAALLLIAGPVQFLAYFARTYATFMAFVNGSINGPEMMDVPTAYGLVRSADGGFIPKGTNAFWVAEAYSPEDPSRVEVVGCVGLGTQRVYWYQKILTETAPPFQQTCRRGLKRTTLSSGGWPSPLGTADGVSRVC